MITSTIKPISLKPISLKPTFLICMIMLCKALQAGPVPFVEDAYLMPAPQELVDRAEHIAQEMDFLEEYEIAVPKKAGMHINPWYKFIASGINPLTGRPFMIINPEWFNELSHDEQTFFLAQNFMRMHEGMSPLHIKILPYLYALISVLLIIFVFIALGYTALSIKPTWMRIAMAIAFTIVCETLFMDKMYAQLQAYLLKQFSMKINELVIEKTGNRDAAIRSLKSLDAGISQELNDGTLFFAPYANLFAEYARILQR
ncbi:MAG: hypothetical protein WD055_03325 [Candidatus Dependentiae bacterium]